MIYQDVGKSNVFSSGYFHTALIETASFNSHALEIGYQFNLNKNIFKAIPSCFVNYSYRFSVIRQNFDVKALLMYNNCSNLSNEYNWGILIAYYRKHIIGKIGTHFRTIGIKNQYLIDHQIKNRNFVHENFNILYLLTVFLKRQEAEWNLSCSLTNIDYFLLNQETNPIFNIKTHYNIDKSFDTFLEVWYKSSGAFNLSVNSFDYFIRTGITCDINY